MSHSYRAGRDRGHAYLLKQQRANGGFGPPERGLAEYYFAGSKHVKKKVAGDLRDLHIFPRELRPVGWSSGFVEV